MSRLKPEATTIEHILRSGGSLDEGDPKLRLAIDLARKGIVRMPPFSIVKCSLEGDPDHGDLTDDQINCPGEATTRPGQIDAICPRCRRTIMIQGKKTFSRRRIILNWSGIVGFVRSQLLKNVVRTRRNREGGIIEVRHNETVVRMCFPEHCESDLYVTWYEHFADPIVYVISNTGRIRKREYPPDTAVVTLGHLLSAIDSKDVLTDALQEAVDISSDQSLLVHFEEFHEKFRETLSKMTPYDFETFISEILDRARNNPGQLQKYERKLKRRSHSLLGAMIRVIGGTGAEDIMVEPKAEYLQNFFSGSGTYEMKKYSSSLKLDDLRELEDHCEQRGTPGILFTSANRVASSVWSRIRSIKLAQGHWKYVVVDSGLISELLIELRLTSLLDR